MPCRDEDDRVTDRLPTMRAVPAADSAPISGRRRPNESIGIKTKIWTKNRIRVFWRAIKCGNKQNKNRSQSKSHEINPWYLCKGGWSRYQHNQSLAQNYASQPTARQQCPRQPYSAYYNLNGKQKQKAKHRESSHHPHTPINHHPGVWAAPEKQAVIPLICPEMRYMTICSNWTRISSQNNVHSGEHQIVNSNQKQRESDSPSNHSDNDTGIGQNVAQTFTPREVTGWFLACGHMAYTVSILHNYRTMTMESWLYFTPAGHGGRCRSHWGTSASTTLSIQDRDCGVRRLSGAGRGMQQLY